MRDFFVVYEASLVKLLLYDVALCRVAFAFRRLIVLATAAAY